MKSGCRLSLAFFMVCVVSTIALQFGCKLGRGFDSRIRGSGSREAWLEATDGGYNGNLPSDYP